MRHPNWGLVTPAYFIPEDEDPDLLQLSDFVIDRAIEDWRYLVGSPKYDRHLYQPAGLLLKNRRAVRNFCQRMPSHPAFGGLLIEIDSAEVIQNMDVLIDVAKEIRLKNIAVSIDNLGTDWPALMGLENFPFAELKVDRQFVTGCANDRLKRTVCRRIIELAREYGPVSLPREWKPALISSPRKRDGFRPGPGIPVRQAGGTQEIRSRFAVQACPGIEATRIVHRCRGWKMDCPRCIDLRVNAPSIFGKLSDCEREALSPSS